MVESLLKERGAEKSGYRGCLFGGVTFGAVGAALAVWYTRDYATKSPEMSKFLFSVMFGSVGFVVGSLVGVLVVFLFDLATRKKEREIDEF